MDRWVCKRCFASNEGDASACSTCGWPRGEAPPPQETLTQGAGYAPVAGPVRPVPWWRPLLRYWWIVAIGAVIYLGWMSQAHRDASGTITSGGSVRLSDLQVGDCFDAPGTGEISEVTGRPCADAHQFELFAIATDSVDTTYPDDVAMAAFLSSACGEAFNAYVGTTFSSTSLGILPVTPTEDGWSHGDRTFFCALYDPAQSRMTGSLRGSGR